MKKLRVTVDGKAYDVLVEILDEGAPAAPAPTRPAAVAPASVASAAPPPVSAPAGSSAGVGDVISPLSGKLVSIDVTVGQSVDEGTQVATVEAMKMNTYLYAPKAGKVGVILLTAGDAVEEGAVLLRIT